MNEMSAFHQLLKQYHEPFSLGIFFFFIYHQAYSQPISHMNSIHGRDLFAISLV